MVRKKKWRMSGIKNTYKRKYEISAIDSGGHSPNVDAIYGDLIDENTVSGAAEA